MYQRKLYCRETNVPLSHYLYPDWVPATLNATLMSKASQMTLKNIARPILSAKLLVPTITIVTLVPLSAPSFFNLSPAPGYRNRPKLLLHFLQSLVPNVPAWLSRESNVDRIVIQAVFADALKVSV